MLKISILVLSAICLCLVTANPLTLPSDHEINEKWIEHKQKYDLHFTPEDEKIQFENFKANYLKIKAHNHESDKTYETGTNGMSSYSYADYVHKRLGSGRLIKPSNVSEVKMESPSMDLDLKEIPASLDWRVKGYVSPVQQQGVCGSCWAFSAVSAIESIYGIFYGIYKKLSVQELIDCTKNGTFLNYGCDGGYPSNALYYAYEKGIVEESTYKYKGVENSFCAKPKSPRYKVRGIGYIKYGDEDDLKKAVATYGPVTIAIDASDWGFSHYKKGIYSSTTCSPDELDHAVLLVGYGTENGQDYWIVKNSWGADWGEDGYVRIARNKNNMCGIASLGSYAYF